MKMDAQKKDKLKAAGIDVDSALHRFMGNEAMVEKYLTRFLNEKSYAALKEAIAADNQEAAAMAAHTLKSVCGTLGFSKMQEQVIAQEAEIRSDNWDKAVAMMPEIEAEYQRICQVIA